MNRAICRFRFVAARLCVLAALAWTPVSAQSTGTTSFAPMGGLDVVVDGAVDSAARLFQNQGQAAILVVSARLPSPLLIHARSRNVQQVPAGRLAAAGGGFALMRGEPLVDMGGFEVVESDVVLSYGDLGVRLRPRPPLVGDRSLDELLSHDPGYRAGADAYTPEASIVARLRETAEPVRVRVVFGSWCSVCKRFLPRGLRLEEELAGSAIRFDYFGLPLDDAWEHPEVKRLGVRSLPTAIVYRGDREIGRFAGAEGWDRPEARLLEAVSRDP
jgi:thiol-disulfide isomerase/thioredoxin